MSETVRGNKASVLRSRIPRYKENRAELWAYTPQPKKQEPKSESETLSQARVRSAFTSQPKKQEPKSESETISQARVRSLSCSPLMGSNSTPTGPTCSFQARPNWLQAFKAEQRNLEQMQNLFMYKIRTMAEQGQKVPGTYKFVVMACNDKQEFVEESPNDSIGKNKKRLADELAQRESTISELKKKLQLHEEMASQKALQLAESQKKDSAMQCLEAKIASVKNICDQMCARLEQTDIKLKDATEQVQRHSDCMTNMTELQNQLKSAADWELHRMKSQLDANQQFLAERSFTIMKLQQSELKFREKYGNVFQEVAQKNTHINLLNNELEAKNEQVSQVMKALQEKQEAVAKQHNTIRLLEEQASRTAIMRTKYEERIASMMMEIAQLKQCLSNHAHLMVANIEDMETVRAQHEPFSRTEH